MSATMGISNNGGIFGWEGSIIDEFLVSTNITYRGGMMNHFHEKSKRSHIIGIQIMILLEDHLLIRPYYRDYFISDA